MLKSASVQITTFVNPHLFWFFEKNDEYKRTTFEKFILENVAQDPPVIERNPHVGQLVLIYDKSIWKRAVVKSIENGGCKVWLVDYGTIHLSTSKVYIISNNVKPHAALVKRAALNEIVNVKQVLTGITIENIHTEEFDIGTIKNAKEHIDGAQSIYFQCVIERNNVHLGELNIIGRNNCLYDLAAVLIENRNLGKDKDLFEKALEINTKVDNWDVIHFLHSDTPCLSMTQTNNQEVLQGIEDILEVKSWGRGIRRSSRPKKKKEMVGGNKNYLEKWLEKTQVAQKSEDLTYESDDDSKTSDNSPNSNETSNNDSIGSSSVDLPSCSSSSEVFCKVKKRLPKKVDVHESSHDTLSVRSGVSERLLANVRKSLESSKDKTKTPSPNEKASKSCNTTPTPPKWEPLSTAESVTKILNLTPAGMTILPQARKSKQKLTSVMLKDVRSSSCNKSISGSQSSKDLETVSNGNNGIDNDKMGFLKKNMCFLGCKCPDCFIATTEDLNINETNKYIDTKTKKDKVFVKPSPLLKVEETKEEVAEIETHVSITSCMSATEFAKAPKVLFHGTSIQYPVRSVNEAPFHKDIHRILNPSEVAFTIQSYAWPCLMRNVPLCIVGSAKSGKTMAYLPAICSNLLDRHEKYEEFTGKTISPLAVIVCPGSKNAEEVFKTMQRLFELSSNKPACVLAIPPLDKECLNNFHKQCDALVTTPLTLLSLLRSKIITVKRVCHLILENSDILLEKFSKEIDSLLNLMQSMLEHRNCNLPIQMVMTTTHWTQKLENLIKKLYNVPTICIASFLEAALYGRADIKMHFLQSKHKMFTLAEILKDSAHSQKTLVLCSDNSEVDEAKEHLNSAGVDTLFMYDTLEKQEMMELEFQWLHTPLGKNLVLICTDQTYNCFLNISNSVQLIHYSLPDTWTQFSNRFGSLLDNYASPFSANRLNDAVPCKVHIFVTETSTKQYPKLVQLLLRMNVKLSSTFIECYKKTVKDREKERLNLKVNLCKNVILFGHCSSDNRQLLLQHTPALIKSAYSSLNCPRRHMLSLSEDKSSNLPKCGEINFKLLNVKNVTTYNMKILEYTDSEGKMHKWKNYENLHEELQVIMAERKIGSFDVKLLGLYALSSSDNSFCRCQVLKILDYQKHTKLVNLVYIRLLDFGMEMKASANDLYELPKKFQEIRPQCVQVHLANMVPPDMDDHWSSRSLLKVEHILKQAECKNDNVFVRGQILLAVENELWVENLEFCEKLSTMDVKVVKLNLYKALQTANLISRSPEPLQELYSLCKEADIELPDYEKLSKTNKELEDNLEMQIEPQWAFLENTDYNEIYIVCVISPSLFYVHLKKFYNLLLKFEDEIQEAIAKPFYPSDFKVKVGKYYLVKDFETENYSRGKVLEIKGNRAKCFFVDYGDERWIAIPEIKYLSNELIAKLPFQAIACRLYGVVPPWDDWEPKAADVIRDYIFEPNTDYFRTLYTTSCKYERSEITGAEKYAILLVDNFKEDRIILINKLLIDCGEALTVKNEDLQSTFYTPKVHDEELPEEELNDQLDDDIDNKELTIDDVQRYAARYSEDVKNNNQDKEINEEERPGTSDSDVSWDIVIENPERFMKGLLGIQETDSPNEPSSHFELPPMRALPNPGYSTPDVQWYQTDTHIKMSIILPDLRHYVLRLSRQRLLIFKATYNQVDYRLDLALFDKIESTFQHSSAGAYVKVTLTKSTNTEWPRLILSSQRMRNIRYDMSQCNIPEEQRKLISLDIEDDDNADDENDGCYVDIGSDVSSDSDIECDFDD